MKELIKVVKETLVNFKKIMHKDEILTLKQVALFLKISPLTVHRLTKRGILPGVKIGSQWRYWRRNIEELLKHPEHLNGDVLRRKVA